MTTAYFNYMDYSSCEPGFRPWQKLDTKELSFKIDKQQRQVSNLRGREADFTLDTAGFHVTRAPTQFTQWEKQDAILEEYYSDVQATMLSLIPGAKKVICFGHCVRFRGSTEERQTTDGVRRPAIIVHADQTTDSAETILRGLLPADEAEAALKGRFQIVNLWRAIEYAASDFPLAVIDWRTMDKDDFVPVENIAPKEQVANAFKKVDEKKLQELEKAHPLPLAKDANGAFPDEYGSISPMNVGKANPKHKFYYQKDLAPEEALLIKCYDSFGQGEVLGREGIAVMSGHTAFEDPLTPADARPRRSVEARCLVLF